MEDMLTTDYDGCGRCLVGVRRLSRKTDKTSSPTRQADQILRATADVGGHIVAWADDWEVSGAKDPLTRRGFGPWLPSVRSCPATVRDRPRPCPRRVCALHV
jgi:site-specific DNA recombinase